MENDEAVLAVLERIANTAWAKQPRRGQDDTAEVFARIGEADKEVKQKVVELMFDHRYDAQAAIAALQTETDGEK